MFISMESLSKSDLNLDLLRFAMLNFVLILSMLFLISVSTSAQSTIYVSPIGSDSNPGTINQPLRSISKAMSMVTAGDTIYLRGGIYNLNSTLGAGVSGTAGNYICMWGYPGEKPILDFSGESYSSASRGIELKRNYWFLKGLTIRNAGDNGIYISGNNNIVENCSVSFCKDTGIQISDGGSYNYIHNCDAFDNNDPATGGQNADGIDVKLAAGPGNVLRGCRVYDNADDGYDCYGTANRVVFDSCWAFHNGYNLWNIQNFTGNGNGFKLGGADSVGRHILTNCVSFDNAVKGFDQNNNMGGITLYNCTAFRNGTYNFSFPYAPTVGVDSLKNDLSFDAGLADVRIATGQVEESNSWQGHTVAVADFLSLDTSLARLPRLPDGSLPSNALFQLAPRSSLIDAGTYVGIPYTGKAPDIGAFESGTAFVVASTNGKGGGDWTSASSWWNGTVPDPAAYVVIMSGDSIIVNESDTVSCNNLTLLSGAKLNEFGKMNIHGTLSLQPNAWFYNSNSGMPSFPVAKDYDINASSNYVHTSNASEIIGSPGYDSTFGNVIILRGRRSCGANLTINGDLIVNTGAPDNTFCATSASVNRSLVQAVNGNVSIVSGQWSCVDGGKDLTGIWNIKRNVTIGDSSTTPCMARMGPLSSASSTHRLGIFNIGGNLSFVNGAKLQVGSSSGSTSITETGIINLGGDLTMDSTTIFGTNSNGTFALNFVGSSPQFVTLHVPFRIASPVMQPVVDDTVAVGSSVSFAATGKSWIVDGPGAFVINGTLSLPQGDTLMGYQIFKVNDGATLGIGSTAGLDSTGSIQVSGAKMFSKKANYVFNGTSAQVTGGWFPDTVNNLTSVNSSGLRLKSPLTVNGMLNVVIGKLFLGSFDLVAKSISGGSITRYVVTDGVGMLRIPNVSSSQVLFPIGTESSYAPVWIANNGSPDMVGVSVSPESSLGPDAIARVNLKWRISSANSKSGNYTLKFGWLDSEEDSAFAADRASYSRIFLEVDSSRYVEAGSGEYSAQLTYPPYTVSRGGVMALGSFVIGNFSKTTVNSVEVVPGVFRLFQNYPNPFNSTTVLRFSVAKLGSVTVKIYNALGQEVKSLFNGNAQPGMVYNVPFNAEGLSSGIYFAVLQSGGQRDVDKILLMK